MLIPWLVMQAIQMCKGAYLRWQYRKIPGADLATRSWHGTARHGSWLRKPYLDLLSPQGLAVQIAPCTCASPATMQTGLARQ